MKKFYLLFSLLSLLPATAQTPEIEWQKVTGFGINFTSVEIANDGYVAVGNEYISGTQVHVDLDVNVLVVKYNLDGSIQWQLNLGGAGYDSPCSIEQTADGGYIISAVTNSYGGDVSGQHGQHDCWVVKLDDAGAIQWQKCIGGIYNDEARHITQTADGGYILSGRTRSNGGQVSGNHGQYDAWLVKLDNNGVIEWQKCIGGSDQDEFYRAKPAEDGGYIAIGSTGSSNGDIVNAYGGQDVLITKVDSSGNLLWVYTYGVEGYDTGRDVVQNEDGSFIIAGSSNSSNLIVDIDAVIIKLSNDGELIWQNNYGGSNEDFFTSIQPVTGSGYILAGITASDDDDVNGNYGNRDVWIVKLSPEGLIEWEENYGGSAIDNAVCIKQTPDTGFIVVGDTTSTDHDLSDAPEGEPGAIKGWIIKTSGVDTAGIAGLLQNQNPIVYPNPVNDVLWIKSDINVAGFRVMNLSGQVIKNLTMSDGQIAVKTLPPGLYVIELSDIDDNVSYHKFIKK